MYISELLTDFLEYLEIEKNRAQRTSENYHLYLMRFIEFADDIEAHKINDELIRRYRLWLARYTNEQGDQLAKMTQAYHLIALRHFLRYLAKRNIASLSPDKIELPSVKRKQVTFLEEQELARLFDQPDLGTIGGKRDLAILHLLYSGGLRVSELVNLNRDHINLKRREFMVRGKGQKDRPIFISTEAAAHLEDYLSARDDTLQPLFLRLAGSERTVDQSGDFKRLTVRSVQRMVAKYAKLAGITKQVSPHTLRHSFATGLVSQGADLRSVQALLGHSNIATTQVYTHVTDPHLRKIHEQFHKQIDAD